MRALLVQSPATSPWIARREWEPPQIGLASIAAQIDHHAVKVLDMVVWRKRAKDNFLRILEKVRPQVVGFTSMTFQYDSTVRFAYLAKQFDPKILTVLGGYHASLFYEQIGESEDRRFWDYLIRGEGDHSFGELLDCLEAKGAGLDKVLGLSYKEDDTFHHNAPRPLEDLSRLRLPARDKRLIPWWRFHMYMRVADVVETSRGCLNSCNFCSIRSMYGRAFRPFELDRVAADIEDAYSRGARHIFFPDDNITQDMDRFDKLCDRIRQLKLKRVRFTTQASPIGFAQHPEVVPKMVEAGLVSVFLGIENVSKRSLRVMQKPNTVELIRKGVKTLRDADIAVVGGFINGLGHDDLQCLRENYEFAKELGITSVMDQILTPYPHTRLREDLLREGRVANKSDFRWYDGYFANVSTDYLTAAELNYARWRMRREILGMWRPTRGDNKYFKDYALLWRLGLRGLVTMQEKVLHALHGEEGRYRLQMKQFLDLNNFGIEIPGYQRPATYNPLFGDTSEPFRMSRLDVLRRRATHRSYEQILAQPRKVNSEGSADRARVEDAERAGEPTKLSCLSSKVRPTARDSHPVEPAVPQGDSATGGE